MQQNVIVRSLSECNTVACDALQQLVSLSAESTYLILMENMLRQAEHRALYALIRGG